MVGASKCPLERRGDLMGLNSLRSECVMPIDFCHVEGL